MIIPRVTVLVYNIIIQNNILCHMCIHNIRLARGLYLCTCIFIIIFFFFYEWLWNVKKIHATYTIFDQKFRLTTVIRYVCVCIIFHRHDYKTLRLCVQVYVTIYVSIHLKNIKRCVCVYRYYMRFVREIIMILCRQRKRYWICNDVIWLLLKALLRSKHI